MGQATAAAPEPATGPEPEEIAWAIAALRVNPVRGAHWAGATRVRALRLTVIEDSIVRVRVAVAAAVELVRVVELARVAAADGARK